MSIITKGLIGLEDLSIGTGTFTRTTSTGGTSTLHQVNGASLGGFPLNSNSPLAPTGLVNGSNTIFTLPTTPGSTVLIFRNGLLQKGGGVDYTLSGSTVTFTSAPLTGDLVLAVY